MTRILLAEHSPHAQRMAERILRDEGYTVITVSDGDTAMLRLKDAKPQLILADVALSGRSGYQICEFVRSEPEYFGTAVVLTFGALESVDDGTGFLHRRPDRCRRESDAAGAAGGGAGPGSGACGGYGGAG